MNIVHIYQDDYKFNMKQLPPKIYQEIKDREAQKMEEALKEVTNAVDNSNIDLKSLRAKLSSTSRRVLDQLKAGSKNISSSDWKTLCKELEKLNVISPSEAAAASPETRTLPIGYFDENEDLVLYNPPFPYIQFFSRDTLPLYANERGEINIFSGWSGDPFQHMEDWITVTQEWLDDILNMRKEDGTPAYQRKDVIPIENHLNSCQKVYDLIKQLSEA